MPVKDGLGNVILKDSAMGSPARGSASTYAAVTPSDAADLPGGVTREIIIGTAGAIKVTKVDGTTDTLTVPVGRLNIQAVRIWATGTTATGITALY